MTKLLLSAALILSLWGINYPFAGGYNANNNYLTLAAKNFVRFGFARLSFLPTYFAGEKLPATVPFYLHHPPLIFTLSAVPFLLFGFQNWVVHVTNFFFLAGDIFLIYVIGKLVWNKQTALWAAAVAAIFPMTTYFWKYIFFEQGSLFFNLCIIYFVLRYLQKPAAKYLYAVFVFTVLSGLTDWGVLYIFVPFAAFGRRVVRPFLVYAAAAAITIGGFVLLVYRLQGGLRELSGAVGVHTLTPTLTSLPVWPVRLFAISIVRFITYFTPFSLVWLFIKKNRVLWFFFLYGLMNVIVLPTVTWEDAYFLFYFIPFFSFAGALWMRKHSSWWIVAAIVLWSVGVNYFKLAQVRKQFWQFDRAIAIDKNLAPYEKVGVVNYSGDILEQYFFHPTQPMSENDYRLWKDGRIFTDMRYVVREPEGKSSPVRSASGILPIYRRIRDFFSVGQL